MTILKLLREIIVPRLTAGLQALCADETNVKPLEEYRMNILIRALQLRKGAPPDAVRFVTQTPTILHVITKNQFSLLKNMIDVPGPGVARMATFGGLAFCVIAMGLIGLKAHTRDPGV